MNDRGELDRNMVCANFAHTTSHGALEGKTQTRMLTFMGMTTGEYPTVS